MERIIKRASPQYIIIRRKDEKEEYFCGARIGRKDNEGVLRVSEVVWSKTFTPMSASYAYSRMKDILDGMRKYGGIEKGYSYVIAETQVTIAITNYINEK